jgi:hypothetical protein
MRVFRAHLAFVTSLVAVAGAAPSQAQIVNGSFESSLAPWTTEGAAVASLQALFTPPNGTGGALLSFNTSFGEATGRFSQSFTLTQAGTFDIDFFLGRGESSSGSNDVALTFRTLLDGQLLSDQLPGPVTSVAFFTQFTRYTASRSLAAGDHILAFEFSRGPSGFGRSPFFVLDAVSVAPVAAGGVPEPASWALMIAGFGLAGAAARRKGAPLRTA